MSAPNELGHIEPETPAQAAARARVRRRRSIALAIALALFAAIFYALTIIKMGPALFDRAL
jgi:ferric-dicitrate binding protein FerR (iron transport regulator)